MSRLDADQLAHAIRTAGSLVAQGALLTVDGVSMAHAVLDLVEERDALRAESEARWTVMRAAEERAEVAVRDRDALAARLASYGQRGPGCSDHGSPYDDGTPR